MDKYYNDSVKQAEFIGRTDKHLSVINGSINKLEKRTNSLEDETAVWRWFEKHPKTAIFLLGCVVSTIFGIPIILNFWG